MSDDWTKKWYGHTIPKDHVLIGGMGWRILGLDELLAWEDWTCCLSTLRSLEEPNYQPWQRIQDRPDEWAEFIGEPLRKVMEEDMDQRERLFRRFDDSYPALAQFSPDISGKPPQPVFNVSTGKLQFGEGDESFHATIRWRGHLYHIEAMPNEQARWCKRKVKT